MNRPFLEQFLTPEFEKGILHKQVILDTCFAMTETFCELVEHDYFRVGAHTISLLDSVLRELESLSVRETLTEESRQLAVRALQGIDKLSEVGVMERREVCFEMMCPEADGEILGIVNVEIYLEEVTVLTCDVSLMVSLYASMMMRKSAGALNVFKISAGSKKAKLFIPHNYDNRFGFSDLNNQRRDLESEELRIQVRCADRLSGWEVRPKTFEEAQQFFEKVALEIFKETESLNIDQIQCTGQSESAVSLGHLNGSASSILDEMLELVQRKKWESPMPRDEPTTNGAEEPKSLLSEAFELLERERRQQENK